MNLAIPVLFTLLLSAEALWLFALSAHIARFMEIVAPIYWIVAVVGLWFTYLRSRSISGRAATVRTLTVGLLLIAAGAGLGAIAIVSA